ncbi:MAG: PTS glucose transporter subunit IIA [Rheinheimera sp.]|nr:PTS glucose transporter subunit IIA [Rheinheimera sp.]
MSAQFQKLQHQHNLERAFGIKVISPVSGQIRALTEHPDALARAGYFGEGVEVIPDQSSGKVAPFDGRCSSDGSTVAGLLVLFTKMASRADVRFPQSEDNNGQGFQWQVPAQALVRQGQTILHFDPHVLGKPIFTFQLYSDCA